MKERFPKSTIYEKINEDNNVSYKLRYSNKSYYELLIILFIFVIIIKSIRIKKNLKI